MSLLKNFQTSYSTIRPTFSNSNVVFRSVHQKALEKPSNIAPVDGLAKSIQNIEVFPKRKHERISIYKVIPPLPLPKAPEVYPSWTPDSRRVGVVARKIGMTSIWDHWGVRKPVTILRIEKCQVVDIDYLPSKLGFLRMLVGSGTRKYKNTPKPEIVKCLKAGILEPKRKLAGFKVSGDALLPLGTEITARHFVPGQFVDIQGTTKGKGFQGAMKRHGFAGQPASHGVSLAHRSIGSVGSNQSPGRVFPGKRMPGRVGNKNATTLNLKLYKIDVKRNLLYVFGQVPGNAGNWVMVRDAHFKKFSEPPPFPTFFPKPGEAEISEILMKPEGSDPFVYGAQ